VTDFLEWGFFVAFCEDYFVFCGLAKSLSVGHIQIKKKAQQEK